MSEKFELLPVDIDLTERNIFGRSNNEFQPQLEDFSRIPDGIKEVERRLAPVPTHYDTQMRFYSRSVYNITRAYNTINTTTNIYTTVNQYAAIQPITIDIVYENMLGGPSSFVITNSDNSIISIDETEPIIRSAVGDIISEFKTAAKAYIETGEKAPNIYELVHEIQVLHPTYDRGRLVGIRTTYRYRNNSFNDTWTYTSTTYDDIDSYYTELEPSCVEELDDLDIDKCYKDEYALILGQSSEYMRKVYRWCEILRMIVPPSKESISSVDLNRYCEFKIEFSTTRDRYNGISDYDWFGLKYYKPFPAAIRNNLSYHSKLRRLGYYQYHEHYSELPGLYVTDDYVAVSYPDIFRQDSYNDRGLHLLEMKVPQYTVIEYDLDAMEAIEPDEYELFRGISYHDAHLEHMYYEEILSRKE
jgi:hypothetical protein